MPVVVSGGSSRAPEIGVKMIAWIALKELRKAAWARISSCLENQKKKKKKKKKKKSLVPIRPWDQNQAQSMAPMNKIRATMVSGDLNKRIKQRKRPVIISHAASDRMDNKFRRCLLRSVPTPSGSSHSQPVAFCTKLVPHSWSVIRARHGVVSERRGLAIASKCWLEYLL